MRVVLIDNHDSYTFNLAAQLEVAGAQVRVLSNDDDALLDLHPGDLDGLVISPGPGTPLEPADVGHCAAVLARLPDVPVLGVCLGHQLLAHLAGGAVVAVRPRHGHLSAVTHDGAGILAGLPSPFVATRYHSLAVEPSDGARFDVTARAEDGVVMAIADRERPWWGVQFHPESIATGEGARVVDGWLEEVRRRLTPRVVRDRVPGPFDAALIFSTLYAGARWAFWLDANDPTRPGLSRLGAASELVTGDDRGCTIATTVTSSLATPDGAGPKVRQEIRQEIRHEDGDIWSFLDRATRSGGNAALPGGYVGYLGYAGEGQWLRADHVVVHDGATGDVELQALAGPDADEWLATTSAALSSLRGRTLTTPDDGDSDIELPEPAAGRTRAEYVDDIARCMEHLRRGDSYEICLTDRLTLPPVGDPWALYLAMRAQSPTRRSAYVRIDDLAICSTTPEEFVSVTREGVVRARPIKGTAPRAQDPPTDAARAMALRTDAKTRAENLMIVDLLRHDLNRVCLPGSVAVPGFLEVETYATLHQLVSTITGRLRPGLGAIDAVRSCFPPGSMTGAPKERTMQIIADLEPTPRGIYSGALGVVGADGSVDLSVVIRTAVCTPAGVTIGVGGAITIGSDPEAEYQETRLKAAALLRAYAQATTDPGAVRSPPAG